MSFTLGGSGDHGQPGGKAPARHELNTDPLL